MNNVSSWSSIRQTAKSGNRLELIPEARPGDMDKGSGPLSMLCPLWGLTPSREVLLRNRKIGTLGRPVDIDHPPPLAVVEELKAVDTSGKRLFIREAAP